jgi:uncharacterized protein (TIGR02611 family)
MHQGEGAGVPDPDSADQVDEQTSVGGDEEHHLLRVEHDNDWAWRRAIRRRRSTLVAYRAVVLTLGAVLVIGGLMMVPLPGPGWLVVLLGLAVLGSEFEPAQRLLDFAKVRLRAWEDWIRGKPWWVQFFVAALTALFVAAVVWVTLRISGVPPWLPDFVEDPLVDLGQLPRRRP